MLPSRLTVHTSALLLSLASCVSDSDPNVSAEGTDTAAETSTSSPAASTTDAGDESTTTPGIDTSGEPPAGYVVGSVIITDAGRTTYIQVVDALTGHISNDQGIEIPGNAVYFVEGDNVFVGLAEQPTWVRYTVENGSLTETGRLSLMSYGLTFIDFGNALVDATTAVSISSDALLAIVWNPQEMTITGTIDLSHMLEDGYDLENFTTSAHDGLVYVPGRWANWDDALILPKVMMTVLDPKALEIVGIAEDDRCASGGKVVFDEDGYGYVMGDGRNYTIQMFANASGNPAPENCILRMPPGEAEFEEDFFVTVQSLTGGLESITELETAVQGSGVAFAKMFYPDELPEGVQAIDWDFWGEYAHKMWRIELGDEPTAQEVDGAPFSIIGFPGVAAGGLLYVGETETDDGTSTVYAIDPDANSIEQVFTMDGFFYGAHAL